MDVNQSEGHSVRGDSRVSRDRDDNCLLHELGKHQSRQAEHGYKRQTSVQCADPTPFPESRHLRCAFSFFGPLTGSTSLLPLLPLLWKCVVRSVRIEEARTKEQLV